MTITLANNAVVAKIVDADRAAMREVSSILSYRVDGAEHMGAFKNGWDGRSSFFDFESCTFPAGFVGLVYAHLVKKGYKVQRARKPLPAALGPKVPKVDSFPEDPRYDYQRKVVDKLETHGQIIAQVATGGGKSRIARLAFARIQRPTLFLTTRGLLMYQMRDTFEKDLGIKVSVIGDGQFGFKSDNGKRTISQMSVGMVQTLMSKLKEPDPCDDLDKQQKQARARAACIKFLELFEFVILEEAHEASGNSYYEILRHCKNAHYRLALTATPFMKDSEEANMRLMGCSGPVAIKVSEAMLIERGILAKPIFKFVSLSKKPEKLKRSTPWQSAYRIGIVENEHRNQHIVFEALRMARLNMSCMVLVQHKRHGEILEEMLTKAGVKAAFIFGEHDQDERKAQLAKLATGEISVLIGSTILDVGVDVPSVGGVILAGGGKAEVALRQRIGRGLRAKKKGPNIALIVDFSDFDNNHLKEHAYQRHQIIRSTPGFAENVLPTGQDFDFIKLGLIKQAA